jgi:hypothetical protein
VAGFFSSVSAALGTNIGNTGSDAEIHDMGAVRVDLNALSGDRAIQASGGAAAAIPNRPQGEISIDRTWWAKYGELWQPEPPFGGDRQRIPLVFLDLENGIEETAEPSYQTTEVMGRQEAYQTFISTGNKEVQFRIVFQVQGVGTTTPNAAILNEVIRPVRWLEALKFPVYDLVRAISLPPPPVMLRIGSFLFMRGIVTSCNPAWKGPFEPSLLYPYNAEVQVTVRSTHAENTRVNFVGPLR